MSMKQPQYRIVRYEDFIYGTSYKAQVRKSRFCGFGERWFTLGRSCRPESLQGVILDHISYRTDDKVTYYNWTPEDGLNEVTV